MPNSQPLFTIATVCFNAQSTLPATLQSLKEQASPPATQHVIVDGGSTDGTLSLIQAYARTSPMQVTTLSEPDKGLYDAMNKALALAQGRYIAFLNAGDRLHSPRTLALMASRIGQRQCCAVYGETDIVDAQGRFLSHRRLKAPSALTPQSFRQGMLVCHQSFYALASIAKRTPYDLRYRYSSDFDWALRVLLEGQRQGLPTLNTRLILTDYLSEGLTTSHRLPSLLERFRIMACHYGLPRTLAQHLWFALRPFVPSRQTAPAPPSEP